MLDEPSKSTHESAIIRSMYDEALAYSKAGYIEQAKVILNETSLEGCTESMVLLGNILSKGTDSERERSLLLYRTAGEAGNSSGYRNLAYCYAVGINVEKDKAKAAELYISAAEMGNARAACNIGVMYDFGNGVEQNPKEAFEWFEESAEGGCTRGMTNLGEYYLKGRGTSKDVAKAVYWFEKSGSPRAIYHLSEIYLDEEGYKDEVKGLEYLKRSAEMEYSRGMIRYGLLVERYDREKAVEFFNKAASKGNKDAIQCLKDRGLPIPETTSRRKKKSDGSV